MEMREIPIKSEGEPVTVAVAELAFRNALIVLPTT
jgi:hypothetical protein